METWVEENSDTNKYINYKFTGKELDEETGLYYFGARYYDSKTSVFMSADPIYDGVKEGFGVYTYCRNNPMIYHDPTGLETKDTKNNAPPHPGAHPDYKNLPKKPAKDLWQNIPNTVDNEVKMATKDYGSDVPSAFPFTTDGKPNTNFTKDGNFNADYSQVTDAIFTKHEGQDWAVPIGTNVVVLEDCAVIRKVTGSDTGYGNYIILQSNSDPTKFTLVAHNSEIKVDLGQIRKGALVSLSGDSGAGPAHLHITSFVVPSGSSADLYSSGKFDFQNKAVNPFNNSEHWKGKRK